jgi:hypothetical protein
MLEASGKIVIFERAYSEILILEVGWRINTLNLNGRYKFLTVIANWKPGSSLTAYNFENHSFDVVLFLRQIQRRNTCFHP